MLNADDRRSTSRLRARALETASHPRRAWCGRLAGAALATAVATGGCYHYRVAPVNSAPADDGHSVTRHTLAWGLVQPRAEAPECQGNGAAEVTASTNFGFVLLSIVTVGFWVPLELEWKCAKDRVRVETELE